MLSLGTEVPGTSSYWI